MASLTIDVIFSDDPSYELGKTSIDHRVVAERYNVSEADVDIIHWPAARAIKITIPRWTRSGSEGDRDVYGCQQHRPLWEVPVVRPSGQPKR
jgi:hypothetical protein